MTAAVRALSALPAARASLAAPGATPAEHPPTLEAARFVPVLLPAVEAQQHSPPDLYTLHLALLI